MKRIFAIFIAMTMLGLVANAQNYVVDASNDTINITTTWSYDTVFVDMTLTILDDVTLTVDPGTVIMFNDFYKFRVEGTLLSQGTENDTIKYTVADTTGYYEFSHTGWDGLDFDNNVVDMSDNDTSRISYSAFYFGVENNDAHQGGAIRIMNFSRITISNCLFKYNYAVEAGGAISIEDESAPVISDCVFLNNNAGEGGGAINLGCYSDDALFDQAIVKNCYFANNKSWYTDDTYYGGGAVKISGYSDALVKNCVFVENSSLSQGGAMIVSGYAQPFIVNNLFINNSAVHNGGAVALKYYAGGYHINNTVVGNYADNDGGAYSIGCDNDSCFFANNIIFANTDLDNDYNQVYINTEDEQMKFYNNNIQGGLGMYSVIIQFDNINEDPMMLDPIAGDFRLACGSPSIDAGIDTLNYFPVLDIVGVPRLVNGVYDMGAYETQLALPVDLGDDIAICDGLTAIIDASENYSTYLWSTTEETQSIEVGSEGTYSVTVANEYLCEATDDIELTVNPLPVVDLGENQIIDDTQSIELNAGEFEDYYWSTDETSQMITVDGTVLGVGVYDYSVTVTDINGCEGSDEVQITVEEFVGINDINIQTAIYPNPSNGIFTVEAIGNMQIIDITGRIIEKTSVNGITLIDISEYPKGIYILRISNNEVIREYKVFVE